jgi:hypothetical protein
MVCIILNKEEYEDDLLSVMMELEITGATILDGVAWNGYWLRMCPFLPD